MPGVGPVASYPVAGSPGASGPATGNLEISDQSAYVSMTQMNLVVTEQSAYVPMTQMNLVVTEQSAYVVLIPPGESGRRRQIMINSI